MRIAKKKEITNDGSLEEISRSRGFSFIKRPFYGTPAKQELLETAPVRAIEEHEGIYFVNREVFNPDVETMKKMNKELKKLIDSLL
jgi:hypothetical protein